MHLRIALLLTMVQLFLCGCAAHAQDRIALVLGNAAYTDAPLVSPTNDALAMAEVLQSAGFVVDAKLNASRTETMQSIKQFGTRLQSPQTKFAVFFYAGHGVQIYGKNYLVPVSASIKSERDIESQGVELTGLLRYMQSATDRNFLVILDACRDDPFAGRYVPKDKGLSGIDDLAGTLLAFATAPGRASVEFDGEKHGLYSGILLKEMQVKGARLEEIFKRTRTAVRVASRGMQIPWENTSLEQELYLFPSKDRRLTEAELSQSLHTQMERWRRVRTSRNVSEVSEFVREFPTGFFVEHATVRLNALIEEDRKAALKREANRQREREQQAHLAAQLAKERLDAQERDQRALIDARARAEKDRLDAIEKHERSMRERVAASSLAAVQRDAVEQRAATAAQRAQEAQRAAELNAEKVERELVASRTLQAAAARARAEADLALSAARKKAEQIDVVRASSGVVHVESSGTYGGYSEKVRDYRMGDVVKYRIVDRLTQNERIRELRVTAISTAEDRVEFNDGEFVSDLMGNVVSNDIGRGSSPRQFYPAELFVGKRWSTRYIQRQATGTYTFDYELRVLAREKISVPAGTFDAFRIEANGYGVEARSRIRRTIWVVPGLIGDIAHEYEVRTARGTIEAMDRMELVAVARN
jgi:hypothetical protein